MNQSVNSYPAGVEPAYVDEKAAARIVAMSVSKLQKLRAAGDGPPYSKVGRLVRYRAEDLHTFMRDKLATRRGDDE